LAAERDEREDVWAFWFGAPDQASLSNASSVLRPMSSAGAYLSMRERPLLRLITEAEPDNVNDSIRLTQLLSQDRLNLAIVNIECRLVERITTLPEDLIRCRISKRAELARDAAEENGGT